MVIILGKMKGKGQSKHAKDYLEWVNQSGLPPLTNTEHHFANWLIDSQDEIGKIGDLETIFSSVRKWVKSKNKA